MSAEVSVKSERQGKQLLLASSSYCFPWSYFFIVFRFGISAFPKIIVCPSQRDNSTLFKRLNTICFTDVFLVLVDQSSIIVIQKQFEITYFYCLLVGFVK